MDLIKSVEFYVDVDDIDSQCNMNINQLMKLFERIADKQSKELGFNNASLLNKNMFWVITRMKFKVIEIPKLYNTYTISTWPLKPSLIKFNRDFQIKENDNSIVNATTEWCILDKNTKRILKSNSINYPLVEENMIRSLNDDFSRFNYENLQLLEKFDYVVKYSEIDMNGHLHNTNYGKLVENCFSLDFWENHKIDEFEINFVNESKYNDTLIIEKYLLKENNFYILAKNCDKIAFKCQISFKSEK